MCRDDSVEDALSLMQQYGLSYCVGSVHHVDEVPIDYDDETLTRIEKRLGSSETLFVRYFQLVRDMIVGIKPAIVGHFDLIRLLRPEQPITTKIMNVVDEAIDAALVHGCVFEINTSGWRKGLQGPYPHFDIAKVHIFSFVSTVISKPSLF